MPPVSSGQQSFEKLLRTQGHKWTAGVDEAGRGPLAGPVVAAAVIFPSNGKIPGVRDSKKLTSNQREGLYQAITSQALTWGVGIVGPREIEESNIARATIKAMTEAVVRLDPTPDFLLIDGILTLPIGIPQRPVKNGDELCYAIAAASIVAKVTRDRLMVEYHHHYPQYNFARHKGYPTREHLEAIRRHGCCAIHRRTFRGVREYIGR